MVTVKYVVKSLEEQIASLKMFLTEPNSIALYLVDYFHLDDFFNKNATERDLLLKEKIGDLYRNNQDLLAKKVALCQKQWDQQEAFVNAEFQKIFGRDCDLNCVAYVNFNPICPRFIESREFDVNAMDDNAGILETSIHEIIHFAWFQDWQEQFPNTTHADMNVPSQGWLISEIAVDPIFKNSELKQLLVRNPAYDHFYQEKINNQNMMEVVNDTYRLSSSIKDFQNRMIDLIKTKQQQKTSAQEPEREL